MVTFSHTLIRKSWLSFLPLPKFLVKWTVLTLVEGAQERKRKRKFVLFIGMTSKTQGKGNTRRWHLKSTFERIKRNRLLIKILSSFPRAPFSALFLPLLSHILILLNQIQPALIYVCFHLCPEQKEKIITKPFDLVHECFAPSSNGIAWFRLCALWSCFQWPLVGLLHLGILSVYHYATQDLGLQIWLFKFNVEIN